MFNVENKKELENLNTLHLPAVADYFGVLSREEDLFKYTGFAKENSLKIFVLGGGSNVVLEDISNFLILKNEIKGVEILQEDDRSVKICVGSGVIWDEFVGWATDKNFSGIEALSFIPGTVGAAPIQNIGAYGQEVSETIHSVEVFNLNSLKKETISAKECSFSYRDSIFKRNPGLYIILSVCFFLAKSKEVKVPDYDGVKEELNKASIGKPTLSDIREIVTLIRKSKLPNWKIFWNAGSFFGNPFVSDDLAISLKKEFPDMPQFQTEEGVKVSAGWLIEKAGLKGFEDGSFKTYEKHALVIIHTGGGDHKELNKFKSKIISRVKELFNVELVQEPVSINKS